MADGDIAPVGQRDLAEGGPCPLGPPSDQGGPGMGTFLSFLSRKPTIFGVSFVPGRLTSYCGGYEKP